MGAIFAIIAIIRQAIFAIVAISLFAIFANNSDMKDLDLENRRWLAGKLVGKEHGYKQEAAKAIGVTSTMLSRIINLNGREARKLKVPELHAAATFFNDVPPGLVGSRERPAPPERRSREIIRVPLLDRVTAGKMRQPESQIPVEDVPLLAFADLGRGDFFALTVDGDSMDRLAPEGATIIINRADRELVSGKPYVLSDRGEASFKLWKPNPPRWAPTSFNPVHEPKYVKNKEAAERMVVGRVKRAVMDL